MRFFTSDRGYIGMAHPQASPGDKSCVLLGCGMPIALRKCERSYKVIGEAYLHDFQFDEVLNVQTYCPMLLLIILISEILLLVFINNKYKICLFHFFFLFLYFRPILEMLPKPSHTNPSSARNQTVSAASRAVVLPCSNFH